MVRNGIVILRRVPRKALDSTLFRTGHVNMVDCSLKGPVIVLGFIFIREAVMVSHRFFGVFRCNIVRMAESLIANKNPFILDKFEKKQDLPTVEVENSKVVEVKKQEEQSIRKDVQICDVGFGTRNYVKTKINDNVQINDELIVAAAVNENMQDARKDFRSKSTFLGALDFLNSQATISLVRTKDKSFDAIA